MAILDLKQIHQRLESEINRASQSTLCAFNEEARIDAHMVISTLKTDLDRWIIDLHDKRISCGELENLLMKKMDVINLENLKKAGVPDEKLNIMKVSMFRLIANIILSWLFENHPSTRNRIPETEVNLFG
ncbi:MAG: hypothetical protein P4L28_11795 [Paludibacteraceae bacterium]|nr:hypothetical protein [Paludibacteraceae bacterium]